MVVHNGRWGTGEDFGRIQGSLKVCSFSVYNSLKSSPFHDCLFKRAKKLMTHLAKNTGLPNKALSVTYASVSSNSALYGKYCVYPVNVCIFSIVLSSST